MRIKQMVTRDAIFWLADKFSFSAPEEMCNEQCGENAYWCQGVKGLRKKKSNRLSRKGEKTFKAGNQILVLQKVYMFLFQSKVYARTDACKALHTWNFRGVNQTLSKAKERFTQGCWVGEKTKVRTQLRVLFISCCAFLGWKSWLKNSVWEVTIPAPTECTSVIYSRC